MLKDLRTQEKHALIFQIGQLFEYDQPSAILATLHRIADRKALAAARRDKDYETAIQWQALADAIQAVSRELERRAPNTDI
jgi:hypothetical protein